MSYRRDNAIKIDVWVDKFETEVDGLLRVRLSRVVAKRVSVGDILCLGDGERVLFAELEAVKGEGPGSDGGAATTYGGGRRLVRRP